MSFCPIMSTGAIMQGTRNKVECEKDCKFAVRDNTDATLFECCIPLAMAEYYRFVTQPAPCMAEDEPEEPTKQ